MKQSPLAPSETRRSPVAIALASLLAGATLLAISALPAANGALHAAPFAHESTVDDDDMGTTMPGVAPVLGVYAHESTVDDDDMGSRLPGVVYAHESTVNDDDMG